MQKILQSLIDTYLAAEQYRTRPFLRILHIEMQYMHLENYT